MLNDMLFVSLPEANFLTVLVLHDSATNLVFGKILRGEVGSAACIEESLFTKVVESLLSLHQNVMGGSHNLK